MIGSIRLALVAASDHDHQSAVRVIERLVDRAPTTAADNTASTRLLVEAIRSKARSNERSTGGQQRR